MLRMNDGRNPRHLTARVRTAAPGARFQWLNSQAELIMQNANETP